MNRKSIVPLFAVAALVFMATGNARAQDPQPPLLEASPPPQESDFMPQAVQQPASANGVPVGTTMAYVGQLKNRSNGNPVNGACDFRFKLWDALDGGTQIGVEKALTLNVSRGLFKAELDFGNQFTGQARWLQTDVKCSGDPDYVEFKPRQALFAAPYAMGLRPGAVIAASAENALTLNSTESGILSVSSGDKPALLGINTNNGYGLQGRSAKTYGVVGTSRDSAGVYGVSTNGAGVLGQSTGEYGVAGLSTNSIGVSGLSTHQDGVQGWSTNRHGVHGVSVNGYGVYGRTDKGVAAVAAYHMGSGDLIRAFNSDLNKSTTGVFAVRNNGRVWTSAVEIYGGGDLAERFELAGEQAAEPGTVMVIDDANPGKLKVSASPYDSKVAGIVSGAGGVNPALTLHQQGVLEGDVVVAITGRVYCKAEARSAPIKPGDLLTTSDTPGRCMKASDPRRAQGAIVGKAMTALNAGEGLVLVLVNLQ